jgi:hypothetical protein
LILELLRTELAKCGVPSAYVVNMIDKAREVGCDVLEGLVDHRIDSLDLESLHDALGLLGAVAAVT